MGDRFARTIKLSEAPITGIGLCVKFHKAFEETKPERNEEDAMRWQATRKGVCLTVESFYHLLTLAPRENLKPNFLGARQ